MKRKKLIIVGAGGLAREVSWLLQTEFSESFEVLGYATSGEITKAELDLLKGVPVYWPLPSLKLMEFDGFVMAIGTPKSRSKLVMELKELFPQKEWPNLVSTKAVWAPTLNCMGEGNVLMPGVVCTTNIRIGNFCYLNLNVTAGHDAFFEDFIVVNPGSNISGGVLIRSQSLIGTGAQILQNCIIGHSASVGAGAVVTKNVIDGTTVVGIPARELR